MKQIITYLAAFILTLTSIIYPASSYAASEPEIEWLEHKSSHFIVKYHPAIPNKYINEFTRKCEGYYRSITDRLGFNRFNFWLWDDRARIFVYNKKEEYTGATGRAAWSAGSVDVKNKIINTFYFEEGFFDVILPHELSHIILREFIGQKAKVPLWFDEGVACANEKNSLLRYILRAKKHIEDGKYAPIADIEKETNTRGVNPAIFYPIAASQVVFILEKYGKNRFVKLCKKIRDKDSFYEAIKKVYQIDGPDALSEKVVTYLNNKTHEDIENSRNFSVRW